IPGRDFCGPFGELRIFRNDAQLFLPSQGFFANLVPTLIELSFEFGNPVAGRVMRGVCSASSVIRKERFLRRKRMLQAEPSNGSIGHDSVKVLGIGTELLGRFVRQSVFKNRGVPLIGIAADKAKEIIKAQAGRPILKRTSLTRMPIWHVVILTEP